jgi:hypothetical protein
MVLDAVHNIILPLANLHEKFLLLKRRANHLQLTI